MHLTAVNTSVSIVLARVDEAVLIDVKHLRCQHGSPITNRESQVRHHFHFPQSRMEKVSECFRPKEVPRARRAVM